MTSNPTWNSRLSVNTANYYYSCRRWRHAVVIQPLVLPQYFHKVQHLIFRSEARHKQLQSLKYSWTCVRHDPDFCRSLWNSPEVLRVPVTAPASMSISGTRSTTGCWGSRGLILAALCPCVLYASTRRARPWSEQSTQNMLPLRRGEARKVWTGRWIYQNIMMFIKYVAMVEGKMY